MSPSSEARTVVLGLGSPIQGDDGVGPAALARLRNGGRLDPAVRLVDGGTAGLALLPEVEDADRLLVLDAIRAGAAPGALVTLEGDAVPRHFATRLSPHQIQLSEVLALAELRGRLPGTLVALGLEPGHVGTSDVLSPAVQRGMGALVAAACARLAAWGHAVRSSG